MKLSQCKHSLVVTYPYYSPKAVKKFYGEKVSHSKKKIKLTPNALSKVSKLFFGFASTWFLLDIQ